MLNANTTRVKILKNTGTIQGIHVYFQWLLGLFRKCNFCLFPNILLLRI